MKIKLIKLRQSFSLIVSLEDPSKNINKVFLPGKQKKNFEKTLQYFSAMGLVIHVAFVMIMCKCVCIIFNNGENNLRNIKMWYRIKIG